MFLFLGFTILGKLHNMHFRPLVVSRDNYETRLQHFLLHDLDKFLAIVLKQQQATRESQKSGNEKLFIEKKRSESLSKDKCDGIIKSVGLNDMPVSVAI